MDREGRLEQAAQLDAVLFEPAAIGLLPGDFRLDLIVDDDASFGRVDQEHPARLEASLAADPLGRKLSLKTVRNLIEIAHKHGIAAMAYLAVYAASLPFAEGHQAWRLFDDKGQPCNFEDFLGLMDPSPGSPWVEHLLDECERALSELPFDGLQVDQYGDPKIGYTAKGEPIDFEKS